MKKYADSVITVAQKEKGYEEKKSNKSLNSKHANAGSGNYTKYGQWMGMSGTYWCAEFVSWCFNKAYGKEGAKALLMGEPSAACETLRGRFKNAGRYNRKPQKGDLIFFRGSRHAGANHIGIVTNVTSGYVYTVEGNTSSTAYNDNGGCVASHCYARGYSRILGYGHPKYDAKKAAAKKTAAKKTEAKYAITTANLRLRSGASTKYKILLVMPNGSKVRVIKSGSWCKVSYSGRLGYCSRKYLKMV